MRTQMRVFCFLGALMAAAAADLTPGCAAAPLSREEMEGVRGGCNPTQYCYDYTCGWNESCKEDSGGHCQPGDPNYPCDNQLVASQRVDNCGRLDPNGNSCVQGQFTNCGSLADCHCEYHPPDWRCWDDWWVGTWGYYPCLN